MAQEGEESLSQAFQRQVDRFQDMQKTTQDMANDFAQLKTQCDTLKAQRQTLTTECSNLQSDRSTLQGELDKLLIERDALRVELAKEHDQNTWWMNRDLQNSGIAFMEHDSSGKMRRKIWHLETRNQELENTVADAQAEKVKDVEEVRVTALRDLANERAISAGLRERIGNLEERIRNKDDGPNQDWEQTAALKRDLEEELHRSKQNIAELEGQQLDLKEALKREKGQTKTLQEDVSRLIEEKQDVHEELSSLKMTRPGPTTPRKALVDKHLNVISETGLYLPTTPTKPLNLLSPSAKRSSPKPSIAIPPSQAKSPIASLAKRYTHLEASHAMLRADYTKLREEYGRDLLRWKEFKAMESERSKVRKRKREEKRRVRGLSVMDAQKDSSGRTLAGVVVEAEGASDEQLLSAADESCPLPRHVADRESRSAKRRKEPDELVETDFEEEMAEIVCQRPRKGRRVSSSQRPHSQHETGEDPFSAQYHSQQLAGHRSRSSHRPRRSATPLPEVPPDNAVSAQKSSTAAASQRPVNNNTHPTADLSSPHYTRSHAPIARETRQPRTPATSTITQRGSTTTPLTRQPSIPYLDSDGKKRTVLPSRMTPWLGGSETPQSSSKLSNQQPPPSAIDRDSFGDDDLPTLLTTTPKTPLVRDRVGSTTSLRRTALTKSVPIHHEDHETFSSRGEVRKRGGLETMTPRDKALELRRLGKMGANEKREYYAEYKGKGRYLPAEEMRAQVLDEYEIDPAQNEGMKHQFHDVKRRKEERKHMCGGDCEECQGYYDAIGEIPKYNTGPRWNDESRVDTSREEDVQAHQNKVSRHRETWRKPPTPPGYWQIGFPSTQAVDEQNATADAMVADREAQIRREAAHKDSKWRKKA